MTRLTRFLDTLLGPHCRHGCGQRIFPADRHAHEDMNHAGDTPPPEDTP